MHGRHRASSGAALCLQVVADVSFRVGAEHLLEACRRLSVAPAAGIYVGDDLRDVQAARAAGMPSVATAWGYLGTGEPPEAWGADHLIDHPLDLLPLLFD